MLPKPGGDHRHLMNPFAPELEAARMARTHSQDGAASVGTPRQETPGPTPEQTAVPSSTAAARPDWLDAGISAGRAAGHWLGQPRPRTALVGVTLLLTGAVIAAGSVWTLPLVIIGVAMIVVAWIGRRLGGHIGVTWGEHGAEIAVRARVSPAAAPAAASDLASAASDLAPDTASDLAPDTAARPARAHESLAATARPEPDDVIESQAHTVEIDVEELKALIAAAEAADRPQTPTVHALRVSRNRRAAG